MTAQEFWQAVFVAAVRGGFTAEYAARRADDALALHAARF